MLLYDALEMSFTTLKLRKDPRCPVCGVPPEQVELIDYEQFCGMPAHDRSTFHVTNGAKENTIDEITVRELKARLDAGEKLVILDVREPQEWQIVALDGALFIPKGDIQAAKNAVLDGRTPRAETVLAQIPDDCDVVALCRSGIRSADAIRFLREIGYTNRLLNLKGGILAWADEIDRSLPKY
jgi:adenylyltransferase/sulfurtransferase